MDDAQIAEIAAQLEREAAQSPACFVGEVDDGDTWRTYAQANRNGFLLIAALCLRAAILPEGEKLRPEENLFTENSDAYFRFLEKRESWEVESEPPSEFSLRDRFYNGIISAGCVVVPLVIFVFFFVGIAATFSYFAP